MINIIKGNSNSGKTRYLKNLYKETSKGDGVLSLKYYENDEFLGYNLFHLKSGEQRPFIRLKTKLPENWIEKYEIGKYSFSMDGFQFAEEILYNINEAPVYIDEIGPLEIIQKEGFYQIVKNLLDKDIEIFLTVRDSLFDKLIAVFSITGKIKTTIIKQTRGTYD